VSDQSSPKAELAPLLDVSDLRVHYKNARGAVVRAIDGVTLSVRVGETLGLVGESGSGKSTFGRAVMGITPITSGHVTFAGVDVEGGGAVARRILRRRMSMVFQNPFASLNPRMTVGQILQDPLAVHRLGSKSEQRRTVAAALEGVGLDSTALNRYPHQFSGGQRQRIGIARALVLNPSLVICDEPVSALDVSVQAQIMNLLGDVQARTGLTFILISHDLAVVRHLADRVAVLYVGKVMEIAPCDALYARPRHPYTLALLASVHLPDPTLARRPHAPPLAGELPDPSAPPSGCRFQARCPLRRALGEPLDCTTTEPLLTVVGAGHLVACHHHASATAVPTVQVSPTQSLRQQ
jgi:peptide/nickel transport system ATP-binding protein